MEIAIVLFSVGLLISIVGLLTTALTMNPKKRYHNLRQECSEPVEAYSSDITLPLFVATRNRSWYAPADNNKHSQETSSR